MQTKANIFIEVLLVEQDSPLNVFLAKLIFVEFALGIRTTFHVLCIDIWQGVVCRIRQSPCYVLVKDSNFGVFESKNFAS